MRIAEGSQQAWDERKREVRQRKSEHEQVIQALTQMGIDLEIDLSDAIGLAQGVVDELQSSLDDMSQIENSTQLYKLDGSMNSEVVALSYDASDQSIIIPNASASNFVHEMTHAAQFEDQRLAFAENGASLLQDVYDELDAYRSQFAFDPISVHKLQSSSGIAIVRMQDLSVSWLRGLTASNGDQPYSVNGQGSANTGGVPININSTKAELMRAYPNVNLSNMPDDFSLIDIPGIIYKR